jgi:hypothetical protein
MYYEPEKFGFGKEERFFISYDGTELAYWKIPARGRSAKGNILQFHGNAENMSTHFINLLWLVDEGYNLYVHDYRGYGRSGGHPDRDKIHRDSILLMNYLSSIGEAEGLKLIVYAQSIGSIIALRALLDIEDRSNIAAVVIEGGFSSYRSIVKSKIGMIFNPPFDSMFSKMFSDRLSPKGRIASISPVALVVMHGENDNIIPFSFGEEIYREAVPPKIFIRFSGGGHMNWNRKRIVNNKSKFLSILQAVANGEVKSDQDILQFD